MRMRWGSGPYGADAERPQGRGRRALVVFGTANRQQRRCRRVPAAAPNGIFGSTKRHLSRCPPGLCATQNGPDGRNPLTVWHLRKRQKDGVFAADRRPKQNEALPAKHFVNCFLQRQPHPTTGYDWASGTAGDADTRTSICHAAEQQTL